VGSPSHQPTISIKGNTDTKLTQSDIQKEFHAETESASEMVHSLYRQTLFSRDIAEHYVQHLIVRMLQMADA